MRYAYVDRSRFLVGLPARDLDDEQLAPRERALLADAVASGIYQPVKSPQRRGAADEPAPATGSAGAGDTPTAKEKDDGELAGEDGSSADERHEDADAE